MVLGIWSFLLIIVANVVCGNDDESLEIPGCIDLDALPNNLAKLENDQIAKLRCLCSSSKRMDMYGQLGVSIMCIYGSRLEDVRQSMLAVNEANRTIHRISINHMAIDETFNETFIDFPLHELQQFEIRSCHGSPVNLSYLIPTTTSLKSLTEITVEDCQLEEMPSELLKRSYNLKVLNLRKNKIIHIKKYELEEVAKSVRR
uniref:Uncharacterized protein n=1 Tax=Acrobeloides nanus TaxID=290746 RepID=A0A914D2S8_9BILA